MKRIPFLLILFVLFATPASAQFGATSYHIFSNTGLPGTFRNLPDFVDAVNESNLIADYDNDGYNEMVFLFNNMMYIEKNNHNSFGPPKIIYQDDIGDSTYIYLKSGASSFTAVDIDSDGDLDILFTAQIQVYHFDLFVLQNMGNLNFVTKRISNVGQPLYFFPYDMDNDGLPDLITEANRSIYTHFNEMDYLHNNGNLNFSIERHEEYSIGAEPTFIGMKVDADSLKDILTWVSGSPSSFHTSSIIYWYKKLPSAFALRSTIFDLYNFNGGNQYEQIDDVHIGDYNHDNKPDIYFLTYEQRPVTQINRMYLMLGNGDSTFGSPILLKYLNNSHLYPFTLADIDHDGSEDIVTQDKYFRSLGNYQFADAVQTFPAFGPDYYYNFLQYLNIDNDTLKELIAKPYNNCIHDSIILAKPNGSTMQQYAALPINSTRISKIISFDYNRDSIPDVLAATYGDNDCPAAPRNSIVELNLHNLLLDSSRLLLNPSTQDNYYQQLFHSDLNNDGYEDLVLVGAKSLPYTGRLLVSMNNHGVFAPPVQIDTFIHNIGYDAQPLIQLADMNGDGFTDIVSSQFYANFIIDSIYIYINSGTGLTYNRKAIPRPSSYYDRYTNFTAMDINHDGKTDLLVNITQNQGTVTVRMLNQGYPNFSSDTLSEPIYYMPAHADFDRDGDEDILSFYWSNYVLYAVFYINNNGHFQADTVSQMTFRNVDNYRERPTAKITDFNGDGWPDILVNSRLFLNTRNFTFAAVPFEHLTADGNFINDMSNTENMQVLDIDRDGYNDLLLNFDENFLNGYSSGDPDYIWVSGRIGAVVPDLAIQSINIPSIVSKNDSFTITVQTKNFGTDTMNYRVTYYLITDCSSRSVYYVYPKKDSSAMLTIFPGQTLVNTIKMKIPVNGNYTLVAYATAQQWEPDLTNNLSSCVSFSVRDSVPSAIVTLKNAGLHIQPNPFGNTFIIAGKTDNIKEIELFSVTGQKIPVQLTRTDVWQVSCGNAAKGVYFLAIHLRDDTVINCALVKD
jgi:hypothetical protein